jgi:hypothetical protein
VAPVAQTVFGGVFAGAPSDGAWLLDFDFEWSESGSLVRAIAKRLSTRVTAGAPPIRAGFSLLNDRTSLGYLGLFHNGPEVSRSAKRFNSFP